MEIVFKHRAVVAVVVEVSSVVVEVVSTQVGEEDRPFVMGRYASILYIPLPLVLVMEWSRYLMVRPRHRLVILVFFQQVPHLHLLANLLPLQLLQPQIQQSSLL